MTDLNQLSTDEIIALVKDNGIEGAANILSEKGKQWLIENQYQKTTSS